MVLDLPSLIRFGCSPDEWRGAEVGLSVRQMGRHATAVVAKLLPRQPAPVRTGSKAPGGPSAKWLGRSGGVSLRTRSRTCVETGQVKPATDH